MSRSFLARPIAAPEASVNRKIAIVTVLALAGFVANYLHLPLYFGVDFLWGSIFSLLAVWLYGKHWGAAVALVAFSFTRILWGHWWAVPVFVAEAFFVGAMLKRRSASLVLLDALFWLCIGMPLAWLIYRYVLNTSVELTLIVILKDAVNGIFNALIASLILTQAQSRDLWHSLFSRADRHHTNSLAHTLFDLLVACVLVPTLLFTAVDARSERADIEARVADNLRASATSIVSGLATWQQAHVRALQILAASPEVQRVVQSGKSTPEFGADLQNLAATFADCKRVLVTDAQGRIVAFYTSPNTKAQLDAAGFRQVRASRRAQFLDVAGGAPRAFVGMPILHNGFFAGAIFADLDLAALREILAASTSQSGLHAGLVDARNRLLVTTDASLSLSLPYPYPAPASHNGVATFQWMPPRGPGPPAMRWSKSFSLRCVALPDLPWNLYVRAPFAPHLTHLNEIYAFDLAIILALTIAALLLAAIVSRKLAQPLQELAAVSTDLPAKILLPEMPTPVWPQSTIVEIDSLIFNFRGMEQTLRDRIDDIQQAQWALAEESARLSEANSLKDDFLAVLSHELRTPLVPILGYADLIGSAALDESQRVEAVRAIERNARAQLRLVEDLLDVTAIMSGKMHLSLGVADLPVVVRAAVETMQFAARAKDIEICVKLETDLPRIAGDSIRLQQVVWNMICNAVKFTQPGGTVWVQLMRCPPDDGWPEGAAQIRVTDNGMGIAASFLPHVFDRFRQAESHLTRSAGGLGLGMFIVRQIVELHDGTIEVSSEGEDRGTTFIVTLPLKKLPL